FSPADCAWRTSVRSWDPPRSPRVPVPRDSEPPTRSPSMPRSGSVPADAGLAPKQARFHTASWHQPPEFRRHGSPFRPTVVVDLILDWLCPLLAFPFVAGFRGGCWFPPCPAPRLAV